MLDIRQIRENPDLVKENLRRRTEPEYLKMLDELIKYDGDWRRLLTDLNQHRHERKLLTVTIATMKKDGKDPESEILKAKEAERKIALLEKRVRSFEERTHGCLMRIPNLLHDSVPLGKDENDNLPVRTWGQIPKFDFPVRNHIELGQSLDIMDIERAGKISGARFFYLKGEGVLLDLGIMNFALEEMMKKGFTPLEPPFLMKRKPYEGVVALDDFESDLYKIENEDLYLIATSEHPMASMFMGEVLDQRQLPLRFAGVSANFRKEAGTHGKDTRGVFRTHQFNKVEQLVFCRPEDSWKIHEELIMNAEDLVQKLRLPYRVVNICTGELGKVAAKRYDLEAWMPAQNAFREIISCSNCTDYQSRRLGIRYREKPGAPPKGYVHILNSTALATGRTIVSILENFQQEDGCVMVPEVLRRHMHGTERIAPRSSAEERQSF